MEDKIKNQDIIDFRYDLIDKMCSDRYIFGAKLWCDMNSWTIPKELEYIKPDFWKTEDSPVDFDKMSNFLRPLMDEISNRIGLKACLRQWNIDRMTDEEFEIFWNKTFH